MKKKNVVRKAVALAIALTFLLSAVLAVFVPFGARADYNANIELLILAGYRHTDAIQSAMKDTSVRQDITVDVSQNKWVSVPLNPFPTKAGPSKEEGGDGKEVPNYSSGFGKVTGAIPGDDEEAKKTAVVVWYGEDQLKSKMTEYYSWVYDRGMEGDVLDGYIDGQKPADGAVTDGSSQEVSYVDPSSPVTGDPSDPSLHGEIKYVDHVSITHPSDGLEAPAYNGGGLGWGLSGFDYQIIVSEQKTDEDGNPMFVKKPIMNNVMNDDGSVAMDVDGKPIQQQALDADGKGMWENTDTKIMVDRVETVHVTGFAEKWTEKGAKVYVMGLGPRSRKTGSKGSEENADCISFNSALGSACSGIKYVQKVLDWIYENHPYFGFSHDELTTDVSHFELETETGLPWYDKPTFRDIMYMFWNTVLLDNPMEVPPEAVDQSLYSVSASLTSYMTKTLSHLAEENQSGHSTGEIDSVGWTSAGSFLGYGDKFPPYKFANVGYIATESRTSSRASYGALKNIGSGYKLYKYARYGHLLSDMGLDCTAYKSSVQTDGWIPGGILWFLYLMSASAPMLFKAAIWLLRLLNPFSILEVGGYIAKHAGAVPAGWGVLNKWPVLKTAFKLVGEIYNGFASMGVFVILPLMVAFFIAGTLLRVGTGENGSRVKRLVARIVLVFIGVPILGSLYTVALTKMTDMLDVRNFAATEMICGNFVDFKGWVKGSRLEPASGMVLESLATESGAGQASTASLRALRKNAFIINKATGVVRDMGVADSSYASADGLGWTSLALSAKESIVDNWKALEDGLGFVGKYINGDFYSAGSFESDAMSFLSSDIDENKMGRRAGLKEKDAPDIEGTVYEFFDFTNELQDWTEREQVENVAVVSSGKVTLPKTGAKIDHTGWESFNFISNGGSIGIAGSVNGTMTFSGNYSSGSSVSPIVHKGLSTLAMYNYLTTAFDASGIEIFSMNLLASNMTGAQHHSVNMIGSGWVRAAYYFNAVAVLIAMCIMGFIYGINMMINCIKRGFHVIVQIPLMVTGVIQGAVRAVVTVCMMIGEILITVIIFTIASDLVLGLIGITEGVLGGTLTTIGALDASVIYNSRFGVVLSNMVLSLLIFGFDGLALAKAESFIRVFDKVMLLIYAKLGIYDEAAAVEIAAQRTRRHSKKLSSKAGVLVVE